MKSYCSKNYCYCWNYCCSKNCCWTRMKNCYCWNCRSLRNHRPRKNRHRKSHHLRHPYNFRPGTTPISLPKVREYHCHRADPVRQKNLKSYCLRNCYCWNCCHLRNSIRNYCFRWMRTKNYCWNCSMSCPNCWNRLHPELCRRFSSEPI